MKLVQVFKAANSQRDIGVNFPLDRGGVLIDD